MNIAEAVAQNRALYESILDTVPTKYEWWSVLKDETYGEDHVLEFERHPMYPTIPAIVSPVSDGDHIVLPVQFGDSYTHIGSTKLEYLEAYTGPQPNGVDYRIKRYDKLVSTITGHTYWVTSAHRSTLGTHTLLGLTHQNPMNRAG